MVTDNQEHEGSLPADLNGQQSNMRHAPGTLTSVRTLGPYAATQPLMRDACFFPLTVLDLQF